MMQCLKCVVSGRVQGVYFRGSTQKQAQALGVTGYAKNLADGNVEVLMCGGPDSIASLQNWLSMGPQYADVKHVQCDNIEVVDENIAQHFLTL